MWRGRVYARSAMEAEMLRVLLAVQLGKFRNHQFILVEGDNKTILESLEAGRRCPNLSFLPLYERILKLWIGFSSIDLAWVQRVCNTRAHLLGNYAMDSRDFGFCNLEDISTLVRDRFLAKALLELEEMGTLSFMSHLLGGV